MTDKKGHLKISQGLSTLISNSKINEWYKG
jgi:hypothetical protein